MLGVLPGIVGSLQALEAIKVVLDLIAVQFLTRYSAKPIYLFGGGGIAPLRRQKSAR